MRVLFLVILLSTFICADAGGKKKCGPLIQTYPPGVDPTKIPVEVCEADDSALGFMSKPIHFLLDLILGRRHQKVENLAGSQVHRDWIMVNVPSYANYTPPDPNTQQVGGWTIRVRGQLNKMRGMDLKHFDRFINRMLIRVSVRKERYFLWKTRFAQMNTTEQKRVRWRAQEIATLAIQNGAIELSTPDLCNDATVLHTLTNNAGSFQELVSLPKSCSAGMELADDQGTVIPTTETTLKPLNVPGAASIRSSGTRKTFFVPPRGLTIVSDVDDVLRVAEIWNVKQAIMNVMVRPYQPWLGMAGVYQNWSHDIPMGGGGHWRHGQWIEGPEPDNMTNVHFHYSTETPELNAAFYIRGTQKYFPEGTFDFRPEGWTNPKSFLTSRLDDIKRLLESFPDRKFILVTDSTGRASMEHYPKLASQYPDQIQCILVRDVEATEPADYFVSPTRFFLGLPRNKYLFFRTPSGSKTPTLANLSTTHLASLAALDFGAPRQEYAPGYSFPPYRSNLTQGCFSTWESLPQSTYPERTRGTKIRTMARMAWYTLKCSLIPRWRRPNMSCPFDRRPGTIYWNKMVEPPHDW